MRIFESTFYYLCFIFCICNVTADVDLAILLYGLVIRNLLYTIRKVNIEKGGAFIPTLQIAIEQNISLETSRHLINKF